ncbi:MAG TPA: PAS domain-containing protein, partial [Candidatus Sulfotelmatobacter sp.]|nr:PAS domain-containing protein [Candidatus Sulfotelmatobacter sp.]
MTEALRAFSAALVDSANDAIISKSLDGIILTWNAAAERLFGYTAREVLGKHIDLLLPADCKEEESQILKKIQQGEDLKHYESVRIKKDG